MAKTKSQYRCSSCSTVFPKWLGKCTSCGSFNTVEEFISQDISPTLIKNRMSIGGYSNLSNKVAKLSEVEEKYLETTLTGVDSLDTLLSSNKGLVKGSITLLGGDPGIGKSTLLLQLSSIFSKHKKVLYISGEESDSQIALRGKRLGIDLENIWVANIAELESIVSIISDSEYRPDFMVIDSIQTIYSVQLQSTPGSVSQIKECASVLAKVAKSNHIDTFIIGHVTKDGDIAGPQVLEHIVDTVLYFEGNEDSNFRTLKAHKNRYGSINEVVIFEMKEDGLNEIQDPSSIFLESNYGNSSMEIGTCLLVTQYKNHAMLIEIQSLVDGNKGSSQYPKRVANGVEYNRLAILIALLNKYAHAQFHNYDIFINVASGFKIDDTASDLAVLLSIISSLKAEKIKPYTAVFGEVSLNGKLRLGKHYEKRIAVAEKTGFKHLIMPQLKDKETLKKIQKKYKNIQLHECETILDAANIAFVQNKNNEHYE